ncbi:DUF2087 domain-containing protein [Acidothermaceae bacterium B102]|nr:DUF2087 domain-containing protein [Acidothermaceae bacterium B102]
MLAPELLSALADPQRLQVYGRICGSAEGVPLADLDAPRKLLDRLVAAGLVDLTEDGRCVARAAVYSHALREFGLARKGPTGPGPAAVAALFRDGRLVDVPREGALRRQLLEVLAERFAEGRDYTEKDVGGLLSEVVDDVAAFRRYLVDHGLLERDNVGRYWRGQHSA